MASVSFSFHLTNCNNSSSSINKKKNIRNNAAATATSTISCTMQPSQNNIKVVINGAAKEIGRAAIVAVTKARGMELAGAVDSRLVGQDAGKISDMEEALEVPILNDLTMVLGSISQSKATGVVVDFTSPSAVYDNVKQAAAFGLRSVVYVPKLQLDTVSGLSAFCDKASMGCLITPTLSIGSVLLQQAAISASFHYNNVEIVESRADSSELPSAEVVQIADNLSNLGQLYNRGDISTDVPRADFGSGWHSCPQLGSSRTSLKHGRSLLRSRRGLLIKTRHHKHTMPHAWPNLGDQEGGTPEELSIWLGEISVVNHRRKMAILILDDTFAYICS